MTDQSSTRGDASSGPRSQSVDRAAELMVTLAHRGPMKLADLVESSGVPRRNLGRLLGSLEAAGFVRRDHGSLTYDLGFTLAWMGGLAEERSDIVRLARPILEALMLDVGTTAVLHLRQADSLMSALVESPVDRLAVSYPIAAKIECNQGVGHLIPAYSSDKKRLQLMPDLDSGRATLLDTVRRDGFFSSHGEVVAGVHAVGVPVFDPAGELVAVVAIASIEQATQHIGRVIDAGEQLTRLVTDRVAAPTERA